MYYLNVTFYTKENKREEYLAKIKKLGIDEKVRKEKGCIRYDYYFADADKNEMLLVELWETKEDQQIHIEQEHMKLLRSFKDEYVESTDLKAFEV